MWKFIDECLMEFKKCFNRRAAFKWFIVAVVGVLVSTDHLGVTSIIRNLGINPEHYESLIHFFHAESWDLASIRIKWIKILAIVGLMHKVEGMNVLIGDGIKTAKEGRKMPCVKKLHQESGNSAKPDYIRGHMFGAIGTLIGKGTKLFCALISIRIHDGNEVIGEWAKDENANDSHVVRMIKEAGLIASNIGASILLLDRYFLTVPALTALQQAAEKSGRQLLTIVTKAKRNAVAYEKPPAKSGRGRKPIKGEKIHLWSLFTSEANAFVCTTVNIYGKTEEVKYLVRDLLWGKTLYSEMRFVLVKRGSELTILACTGLFLTPEKIIELYSLRFKIECSFREFKQVIAGFAYRFWSSAMPKFIPFEKNETMRDKIKSVSNEDDRNRIVSALKATEGFVMISCIAFGLLQMTALLFGKTINSSAFRWLRTRTSETPSEATTADFMRKTIFRTFYFSSNLGINRLIKSCQLENPDSDTDSVA